MKVINVLLIAAAMAVTGAAHAASPSQPQVEYSADSVLETEEMSMKGKIHYTPTRERREMIESSSGEKMITITRHDKKIVWTLMPAEEMYMEMRMGKAKAGKDDLSKYKIEQTVVGPETLNGVSTTKNKILMTGEKGEKMGGFMWVTKDKIMVKLDAIALDKKQKYRFKSELTNLKIGKQEAKLFEVPPGYEKMSIPGMPGMY